MEIKKGTIKRYLDHVSAYIADDGGEPEDVTGYHDYVIDMKKRAVRLGELWPIMSKRMLDTLLSVGSFRYRAYPALMIDCKQVYNENLGRDINSGIKYDNFFAVQVLEDLDVFDWENSVYERDSESPDVLESIEELVLKEPEEGFPPMFRVVTSYLKTRLYIFSEARLALEAAGIRGVLFRWINGGVASALP
jgi:hypothetical protein